jgi:O-acetyl-ADP-ribose deacetylase (regulator of RNase III)
MIRYIAEESIFNSTADVLVNPVNCRGVMGKGLALEFKRRFPECEGPYKSACESGQLRPGGLVLVRLQVELEITSVRRPGIVLFATKDHWRGRSKIEWIEHGLASLKQRYSTWGVRSMGVPALGCGLGGLRWEDVKPLVERYLEQEAVDVEVYLTSNEVQNRNR